MELKSELPEVWLKIRCEEESAGSSTAVYALQRCKSSTASASLMPKADTHLEINSAAFQNIVSSRRRAAPAAAPGSAGGQVQASAVQLPLQCLSTALAVTKSMHLEARANFNRTHTAVHHDQCLPVKAGIIQSPRQSVFDVSPPQGLRRGKEKPSHTSTDRLQTWTSSSKRLLSSFSKFALHSAAVRGL